MIYETTEAWMRDIHKIDKPFCIVLNNSEPDLRFWDSIVALLAFPFYCYLRHSLVGLGYSFEGFFSDIYFFLSILF